MDGTNKRQVPGAVRLPLRVEEPREGRLDLVADGVPAGPLPPFFRCLQAGGCASQSRLEPARETNRRVGFKHAPIREFAMEILRFQHENGIVFSDIAVPLRAGRKGTAGG